MARYYFFLPQSVALKITRNLFAPPKRQNTIFFYFFLVSCRFPRVFVKGFHFFFPIYLILCFSTSKNLRDEFVIMGSLKESQRRDMDEDESKEPLLMAQNQRFTMFPIRYKSIWEMYKKAEASFWTG